VVLSNGPPGGTLSATPRPTLATIVTSPALSITVVSVVVHTLIS
jgi:hypothetical protein